MDSEVFIVLAELPAHELTEIRAVFDNSEAADAYVDAVDAGDWWLTVHPWPVTSKPSDKS